MIRPLLLFCTAALCSSNAFGFGCDSHQMIALIARAHLTPAASEAADRLLLALPIDKELSRFCRDRSTDLMADSSTWADDARSDPRKIERNEPWHFIDIPLDTMKGDAMKWCPPITDGPPDGNRTGCVVNALEMHWNILRDKTKSDAERAKALRYVIHFVGDIHQPLHTSADSGGNCITLHLFNAERATNLHSTWDSGMMTRYLTENKTSFQLEAKLIDLRFGSEWTAVTAAKPDFTAWAWESHSLAIDAYNRLEPHVPASALDKKCEEARLLIEPLKIVIGDVYFDRSIPIIERRIALAGYRLAALLNQALR